MLRAGSAIGHDADIELADVHAFRVLVQFGGRFARRESLPAPALTSTSAWRASAG